jgi:hypothetical protein
MAYNKVLQNTLPTLNSFEDDNSIIKKDNSLSFIDKLNLSKKIDGVQNSIDQIVFDGTNIIVSGNLKFLDTSTFSSIKSLSASSVLKFSNLDVGLKLNSSEDLEFYNNIEGGEIHLSGSIRVPSNKTIFINNASGSITHLDELKSTSLVSQTGGGISVSTKKYDDQKPETEYLEISLSTNGDTTSAPFNMSYLSNDRIKCKVFKNNPDQDPDILQLKGNYYYHADYTNPGGATPALANIFGTFWANNTDNGSTILHSNSYRIIPQCTILRPLNSSNPGQDNIDHYFSGDTHYVKLKNNDTVAETSGAKTVNMFLLDLTSTSFMSKLKAGFKIDIMIDEYKQEVFEIIQEGSTFPAPGSQTLRSNARTNYLPNRKFIDISGGYNSSKFWPIGFEYSTWTPKLWPSANTKKQLTGGYFPFSLSRQASSFSSTTYIDILVNGYNVVEGGYNATTQYRLPTTYTPQGGDFFYFEVNSKESNSETVPFVIQGICSIGSKPAGKLIMNTNSNKNTYIMNNLPTGITKIIFKFVYNSSNNEWEYVGGNLGSQEDFEEQFMADFGLLERPTSFCIELPEGHNIINLSTDAIASTLFFKNTYDFYLYGNRETVFPSNSFLQGGTHRRIKGGWLKINNESNLPFNQQLTPIKSGFKKLYNNLFLLNPKTVGETKSINTGFSWPQYSNFQFTYLGNNQWFMS